MIFMVGEYSVIGYDKPFTLFNYVELFVVGISVKESKTTVT